MKPRDLQAEQFSVYPPEARRVATDNLEVLRQMPITLLPSLLQEIIEYDFRFPAERKEIDSELAMLRKFTPAECKKLLHAFETISTPEKAERFDWVNQPARFLEQQSAYLWSSNQMDAFRAAAIEYHNRLLAAIPPEQLPIQRLGIAIIGQGVPSYEKRLFRNLQPHGTFFDHVNPEDGLAILLAAAAERADLHRIPYGHWYIDGGEVSSHSPDLYCISYSALAPTRNALLEHIEKQVAHSGVGPEELRTYLAHLTPAALGIEDSNDAVMDRFQLKILTEGSGTQIFSTTFVQWSVREVMRRSQPLTVIARSAPRQRQRPMNELLAPTDNAIELDPEGSLVDADIGAYYHWVNQQRLGGSEQSSFLAWFEGHNQALAISPNLPRNKRSSTEIGLRGLLSFLSS
jgi:hypothetical protein